MPFGPSTDFMMSATGRCFSASAQSYSINWYKVAGGGGTSTNAQFSLSGTIGQPDASGAMTGNGNAATKRWRWTRWTGPVRLFRG